ncbi:MAG: hypothetical protein RL226_2400 [Bacteroidota bacterium]|jgi:hypothetical protein
MKKFYLVLGAFVSVLAVNAQLVPQEIIEAAPNQLNEDEVRASMERGTILKEKAALRGGGSTVFYEDFANGFDGNNGIGAWTVEDSGNNTIWMVADANSPGGEWSTTAAQLNSTTADNGWVIFDCDLYNTQFAGANQGQINGDEAYVDVEGWLVSPVIDLSALGSVIVSWEQYFRYCCFSFAPVFLEVSNDGGSSWVTFPGHGSFIESANAGSANPLPTSVDVSCVAAGESNVRIRFAYKQNPIVGNGYSHYFWGIDDVAISENPLESDIEVIQLTNGDIFNYWEYRHTPLEQAIVANQGGLKAGAVFVNNGFADQTNVVATFTITDADGNVVSTSATDPFTIPSSANSLVCPQPLNDTLYHDTGWVPTAIGNYTLSVTFTSDIAETDTDNNTLAKTITYSTDEYGHDSEESWNVELRPRTANLAGTLFDPTGYGSFYGCPNSGSTAYGFIVALGPNTELGVEFESRLYEIPAGVALNDADFTSSYYEATVEMIPSSIAGSEYVYLPFEDAIDLAVANGTDLNDDVVYFLGVMNDFESDLEFTVVGNGNSDSDNSTGVYQRAGDGSFVWFTAQTATPAVRLITSPRVAVDEIANKAGLNFSQNYPNPADGITNITLDLVAAREVAFEVTDMNGRLVYQKDMGTLSGGTHNLQLDVTAFANGVYTYTVIVNNTPFSKQMVVAHN